MKKKMEEIRKHKYRVRHLKVYMLVTLLYQNQLLKGNEKYAVGKRTKCHCKNMYYFLKITSRQCSPSPFIKVNLFWKSVETFCNVAFTDCRAFITNLLLQIIQITNFSGVDLLLKVSP